MISLLYVDDEPDLLTLGKLFLEREGEFSVTVTTSSQEVIGLLERRTFDAIISDYQMPGMDGIELLKQVRSRDRSIPFILFTGKGREEVVIEAINNGADFYLQKGGDARPQFAELRHKILAALERRRAVDALRDSEQRLSDIINFLPDATFAINTEGNVIAWNKAIENMTGISAADMLGRGQYEYAIPFYGTRRPILIDLVLNPDGQLEMANYLDPCHSGTTLTAEAIIENLGNNPVHIWAKASRLFNEHGDLTGAIESIRDITERKRVEDELRMENEKNQDLMNNASDAIFITDAETGMFTDANRKAQELVGKTLAELRGMHFTGIHPGEFHELYRTYFSQAADEGAGSHSMIVTDREGRYVPVIASETAIDLGGRRYIMGIFHDISEIQMAQDTLQLTNKKLNLLAEITRHDIRNKLTVLGGYLELVREHPREPDYTMYIRKIHELVGNISENIEFTRLYQNLGVAAPDWQNVHNVFFHACARIDIGKICVQSDTGDLEIFADPLLERAFHNLAENAVQHGGNVTTIRISARESREGVTITIEDDGTGIPPSDKIKIFSKGYGKNTGLGLFLVREVLSITGISIHENGEYRKGARFELFVPHGMYRYRGNQKSDRCHLRIPGPDPMD